MNIQEKYSNVITEFLRTHPAISSNRIEEELNLPQSTIGQALNGGRLIPVKHIFPLLCYLARYGLELDGYQLNYDPADGLLTGRKWVENKEVIEVEGGSSFEYIVKEYRFLASDYFDLL